MMDPRLWTHGPLVGLPWFESTLSPKSSLLPRWSFIGGEAAPTRAEGLLGGASIVPWQHGELDGGPRVGFWRL
jgi:hypothetical protein